MEDFLQIENYLIKSLKLSPLKLKNMFQYPSESRFKEFFTQHKAKKKRKTMKVNPKNVNLGLDKRTSIIIKNIPDYISDDQFRNIILHLNKNIDFFYVPSNIKTRKNLRVAFVNVLESKQIVPIYMGLYKMKFVYNSPNIEMEICYSKVQGKEQLMRRFFPFPLFINNNLKSMY
jgi:hypothetical protein